MIAGALARLSSTPKYEAGMRAYDVRYYPPDGDSRTVILTSGNQYIGQQIRETLFANHPKVTDYTFKEFDYLAFQYRTIITLAVNMAMDGVVARAQFGENFIDETQLA